MAAHPSQWLLRAVELLEDGEWHDYQAIVRQAAKTVPPGQAMRKTERMRRSKVNRPGNHYTYTAERRVVPRTDEQLIEFGASAIVRDALAGSVMFEINPRGTRTQSGPKQIRLLPGMTPWRPPDG